MQLARKTRAVCFGSLAQRNEESRATINAFHDAMPDTPGTLKVFDINLRQHFYTASVIENSLKKCNILKINDEELEIVTGMFRLSGDDAHAVCRQLMDRYELKILILTCGIHGSYVFTAGEVSYIGTPEVQVADTVGAGDSFTAAFVTGLLTGMNVGEAHKRAVDTSAYVCTCHGAMPLLPADIVTSSNS